MKLVLRNNVSHSVHITKAYFIRRTKLSIECISINSKLILTYFRVSYAKRLKI